MGLFSMLPGVFRERRGTYIWDIAGSIPWMDAEIKPLNNPLNLKHLCDFFFFVLLYNLIC